ncbi:MAG TPA: crotonase/enoyl-CoA hydratase family protein [Acidimicrobiales bacterium]|nr:crotonase/enoyl-CoA hydratase family protein [Acidimicrobiales bacterium]
MPATTPPDAAGSGAGGSGVRIDRVGLVTVVTIDRPAVRNAVDSATAASLRSAFCDFSADDSAHVAVLTGAGSTFCAGADLKAITAGDRRPVPDGGPGPMGPTRDVCDKPVIAAVEGHAVAGGLELALWCDLRVASRDAVFGVFCRRFGVPLVDLGTVRLPRLIGHSRAMDLILTGRAVSGAEAFEIGLANRVTEPGGALDAALALAGELAALPQICLRSDRLSAIEQWGLTEDEAARNEARRGREVIASGETLAGAARFAEGAGRGGAPA